MLRKDIYEQGTDRWISSDPLDNEIIERLFKKDIREGEEKLMLAVLEVMLLKISRSMCFRRMKKEGSFSKKRKSGF